MNRNDFKNPLIQSGAVLLFVFLLISIVANAESHGILGSLSALISGLFSGIIFIIGLFLAIIVSVTIIIGLFILAVSFHSVEKARDLFEQLKSAVRSLYMKIVRKSPDSPATISKAAPVTQEVDKAPPASPAHPASPESAASTEPKAPQLSELEQHFHQLREQVHSLSDRLTANSEAIAALQSTIGTLQQEQSSLAALAPLEQAQQLLNTQVQELTASISTVTDKLQEVESKAAGERASFASELKQLKEKTSVPEVVSGILSYIDLPEDRDEITKRAEEAVARGLTYAQTDEFFKSSFKPKIYKVLAAHPRLTKDFIRSIKKKF